MASVSDEVPSTKDNEVKSQSSSSSTKTTTTTTAAAAASNASADNGKSESVKKKPSTKIAEEKKEQVEEKQKQSSTSTPAESNNSLSNVKEGSSLNPSTEFKEENHDSKLQEQDKPTQKSRSVNFSTTTTTIETEEPKLRPSNSSNSRSSYSPPKSSRGKIDFIDTLVESYKLETSNNMVPTYEEVKYVPKTSRSRINPNWREHRTRRLMNKLEELSLWDREEELKAAQAQSLREQKWEQILDRQRNHDLCLYLMRQRHESEMESAVKLDVAATGINDENTSATIANAVYLSSTLNGLNYDSPLTPQSLKRRVKQDEENAVELKTPIGRYRQFEKNMNNKLEKINQKLKPDREIMNAYNPNNLSIPAASVPLFSETYSALLSVPDTYSSNKYNQYHYGVASYLHQPHHASSPDFETRLRSYATRDVRVPLKEQANADGDYDDNNIDEYNRSNLIDNGHRAKHRSTPIDNDYFRKYRSSSNDDGYYSKYRSNRIDEEYDPKYRSSPIEEEDYSLKYRSNPIDENYNPRYRSKYLDDDYNPKSRSKLVDGDYSPKARSKIVEDDYELKYRSKHVDDDYNPKSRSKPAEDDYNPKYRSHAIDDEDEDYYPKYRTKPATDDDNYYTRYRSTLVSKLDYSPPRRTTSLASPTASALYDPSTIVNTPREFSFIHSRQPTSNSIHQRSLNDDLNAITRFSTETSKKILQNIGDSTTDISTKSRSSPMLTKKYAKLNDQYSDDENIGHNSSHNHSSKTMHQPAEIISLSSTR